MKTTNENRLITLSALNKKPDLLLKLEEKWVVDYGYDNSLGMDSALLVCKKSEL